MAHKTIKLKIYGYVQGVFYRHSTKQRARELNICGYVKNLADGTVEVVACGRDDDLKQLIEFCRNNPGSSQVEKIKIEPISGQIDNFDDFKIKYI